MSKPRFKVSDVVRITWRDIGDPELHELPAHVTEVTETLIILQNGMRFHARSGMLLTNLWVKPEVK